MRPFDFAPHYRSTVGFGRLVQMLDSASGLDSEPTSFPPYDIERLADDEYRITVAVAGFSDSEIKVEVNESTLSITGAKPAESKERRFMQRGIAARAFERRFRLADHVEARTADLKDGLLNINLVRNVPARLRPRTIAIGKSSDSGSARQIEARA